MPEAKLQSPLSRCPPSVSTALPGRVPWPAITGKRSPPNSCETASSPRNAAPVPTASPAAMCTQPTEGSPYVSSSITLSESSGMSSDPPTDCGTHMPKKPAVVQRVHDRLGQLARGVVGGGVLIEERQQRACPLDELRGPGDGFCHTVRLTASSSLSSPQKSRSPTATVGTPNTPRATAVPGWCRTA